MREIKNHYFKDYGDGMSYMSGLPLPAENKVVRDIKFIDCKFNVAWEEFTIVNCEFEDCYGSMPNGEWI